MHSSAQLCLLLLFFFCHVSLTFGTIPLSEGLHQIYARNAADHKKLGENCTRANECVTGAVCLGTCRCKNTHVPVEEQCWKKVEPGNVGCTYDEQCEGVWPMTTCQKGQCACGDGETLIETREGNVCVVPGACPTNGINGALYERATHRVSTCLTFTSKRDSSPQQQQQQQPQQQFIGCDEYPEVYDCVAGICCPTRGIACIQPLSRGDSGGEKEEERLVEEERFWYNSATGQCLPFRYTGRGGNSNNFLTQWQCESYCGGRCTRGDPIPQSPTPTDNYFCKIHESDRLFCCPTPAFICSSLGGVNVDKSTMRPFSNGSPRRGADVIQRWYWDTNELACKRFKYYGQGGNFNNFAEKEECVAFCASKLCAHGAPLKDPSDNIQRCAAREQCPETHECRQTVCCPKPLTTCLQALRTAEHCEPGDTSTRWTYSVEHAMCKSIVASRCLLGDNQFESLEECQAVCSSVQTQPKCPVGRPYKGADNVVARCSGSKPCPSNYECVYTGSVHACCPTREFTCHQGLSIGTSCGMSTLPRWHYDPVHNRCNQFEYQGCSGNDNNFVTRLECVETCHRSECPDGGEPLIDSSNGRIIACERNDDCPSTHSCTRQLYTNRTSCCPSRKWICSHDANEGVPCGTPSKRFYFDPTSETCRQFNYLGCGGNANSFSNRVACYQFCQSASCASSEVVYQPSNLDEPFDCSLKSCPRHFSCVKSVWDETKNVCCGSPNFGVCPSALHPMLEFSSQQPMTCTPNSQNSCPLGFQCMYSSIRMLYFCCRDIERIDKCLKGSKPEIWQSTAEPRSCSRDSQCPSTTACFAPIPFSSGLCCASVDDVCPATFIYEQHKSEGVECSPLERNTCGSDGQSVCLYSDVKTRFVCCRREARQIQALAKCPPGSIVELSKTYCDPESPCPKTHFCMKKSTDRKGICCRHPSLKRVMPIRTRKIGSEVGVRKGAARSRCPKGDKMLRVDGEPKQCGADEDCPEFFRCTSQPSGAQSVCCGLEMQDICPTRVYPAIRVKKCSLCAVGYECHKNYCCPQKEVACTQPIPVGGAYSEEEGGVTRYYYDSETNTCHSFLYLHPTSSASATSPSSAAQNHFADHESCIEMCVQSPIGDEELQCPHPYLNPLDHPQMCIAGLLKTCADSETCLRTASGASVCCQHPPSFQMLMNNLCGASYVPTLNKSGNPIRCSSSSRCQSRICRQSPVLRYSICCQRRTPKTPRLLIRPLSEGQIKKPICRSEAESTMGTCLPKLYPGETECELDEQCVAPSSCFERKCVCPKGTVQFRRMCASVCPIFYKNQNGVCV